ncbi:DUF6238 family protein [Streptomyces sp. NPDC003077]|uniref:DUF6238 family protein n=1 Tax=Streptomyces sp. NPDC003077 TaxID=3154443 RepID=UPI00339F9188
MTAAAAPDAHPYLRAASAGIRHHARTLARGAPSAPPPPGDRLHLDVLHVHLITLHRLLDQLTESTRPPYPAAARHLAATRTRLWQATAEVHDAFHLLPTADTPAPDTSCRPERLPDGPPVLTICQRHLAAGHSVRRTTTPTDLNTPLHGHTTTCSQ